MSANISDKSSSRTLTARQREIIRLLAKTAGDPIPVGAISEKLNVSSAVEAVTKAIRLGYIPPLP